MLLRIAVALFFSTLAVFATAERLGIGIPIPLEEAIRRELNRTATPEQLNAHAVAALDRGDISEARSFADLAAELNRPLPAATMQRLEAEEAPGRTAMRNAGDFAVGFVSGSGEGAAGLAGAVISDFTVVGDLRDISREGSRMALGEPYSQLLLGLSAVGIAATGATIATGGGGAPLKISVSLLKAAWRAGDITAGFAVSLGKTLARTVDFTALDTIAKRLDLTSPRSLTNAAGDIARTVHPEAFADVASNLAAAQRTVGTADTVRLLRYVHSTGDLADLPAFTAKFGSKSRAVAALTGRASLRGFKTVLRVADFLLEAIVAVLAWFGGLMLAASWGAAKRLLQALIRATSRRKRPSPPPAVPIRVPAAKSAEPRPEAPRQRLRESLRRAQAVRLARSGGV